MRYGSAIRFRAKRATLNRDGGDRSAKWRASPRRQDQPDDDAEADEQIEDNDNVATVDAHGIPCVAEHRQTTSGTHQRQQRFLPQEICTNPFASCLEQVPFVPKSEHAHLML